MAQQWRFGNTRKIQIHPLTCLGWLAILAITLQLGCGKDKPTGPDVTPPAGVGALSAVVLGSDTVLLSWTAPGDDANVGLATAYDARRSSFLITPENFSQADTLGSVPKPATPGTGQQLYATGLPGSSTQYFAIRAVDELGNWSPINVLGPIGTLADTIPPGPITALNWEAVTDSSVSLAWRASGDDGQRGTASQYDLRVSPSALTEANWRDARHVEGVPAPRSATTPQRTVVTGLLSGRTYYFALHAYDEAGSISQISNILITKTGPRTRLKTWRVAQDGSGDATSIQAAIDSTVSGDSVLVFPGTYFENILFRDRDIVLRSQSGPDVTIIDGSHEAKSTLAIRGGVTRATVIEGFTITHGVGSELDDGGTGHVGGGILILHSSPTIRSNVIRANGRVTGGAADRTDWGGGVYCGGRAVFGLTSPLIENNSVIDNVSYTNGCGIGGEVFGSPVIIGNTIRNNLMTEEGDGGGIWLHSAYAGTIVRGNYIEGNIARDKGGGLMLLAQSGASQIEVSDNVIVNNLAQGQLFDGRRGWGLGGGMWVSGSSYHVFNNTIVNNQGADIELGLGGAILVSNSCDQSIIERNIIAFTRLGGGIYCANGGVPQILNNIAWSNSGGDGTGLCPNWSVTNGNIQADPLFCDLPSGSMALAPNSPALTNQAGRIGAATPVGCGAGSNKGTGKLRP